MYVCTIKYVFYALMNVRVSWYSIQRIQDIHIEIIPKFMILTPSISRRNLLVTAMRSNWKTENIYNSEFACFPFIDFR